MDSGTAQEVPVEIEGWRLRVADEMVPLGEVDEAFVPAFIEVEVGGHDGQPVTFARVEVRDGVPGLVELRFTAAPGERDIRQADLRDVQVSAIVEDLVAGFTFRVEREGGQVHVPVPYVDSPDHVRALHAVQRARAGKATRTITPQLLERVAAIYRKNVQDRPTLAVQRAFLVSPRMASEYVQRARRAGLLPPTSPGKKKA